MKKAEAEIAINELIGRFKASNAGQNDLSYSRFREWFDENMYGHYFNFRSTMGPEYDAELWFDQQTGQVWKR